MPGATRKGYANPDVLATTAWVAGHLDDPTVRIVESNEDTLLYGAGHIPGAVEVDWTRDLNDQLRRDYLDRAGFEALMSRIGVTPET
ncbi:MAG: sulfurtransferase, partial [Dehalococcoidia bacterium]